MSIRVIFICAATLLLAAPALAAQPQTSLQDIEDEVMCPICGTTLEQSGSPQAERERQLIRRLIDEGRGKEEIKEVLVREYGEDVIAAPGASGFDLAAWLLPVAALLLAAAGIVAFARRSREANRGRSQAPAAITPAERERLDADLTRHEGGP